MMRSALRLIRENGAFDCILTTGSFSVGTNAVGLELGLLLYYLRRKSGLTL